MRNKNLIFNYVFLGCLAILFLNDHFFKYHYTSWFTGKLSDIVGIILLPMLLTYLFPKLKQYSVYPAGVLFAFWKSPFSESCIGLYNSFSFIPLYRVVDYTDLIVLLLLPVPYLLIKNSSAIDRFSLKKLSPSLVLLPTILTLMSTSPGNRYFDYVPYTGNLYFNDYSFDVNQSRDEILSELKKRNIRVQKDTARIIAGSRSRLLSTGTFEQKNLYNGKKVYQVSDDSLKASIFRMVRSSNEYKIDSIQLDDQTVWDIQFDMHIIGEEKGTRIFVKSARIGETMKAQEVDRKLRKLYGKLLKEKFKTF